jgi:hypothetical protein
MLLIRCWPACGSYWGGGRERLKRWEREDTRETRAERRETREEKRVDAILRRSTYHSPECLQDEGPEVILCSPPAHCASPLR